MAYKKPGYLDISTGDAGRIKMDVDTSKDKRFKRLSYEQARYPNGAFSFRTDSGKWMKLQIGYPYNLESHKWAVWQRTLNDGGDGTDVYNVGPARVKSVRSLWYAHRRT